MAACDVDEKLPLLRSADDTPGDIHVSPVKDYEDKPVDSYFQGNCNRHSNRRSIEKIVVGMSAFLAYAILFGFRSSLSIYFVEFKNAFPNQDQLVSLAIFLPTGIYGIIGVLTGSFNAKFGVRKTALLGSILLCLGIGLSSLVSSVVALIVYLGLIAGSGTSFMFISINCALASFFDEGNKPLMSIISVGGAFGSIVFPIFVSKLTEIYSWRGSLILLCGLSMNSIPFCLLYSLKKLPSRRKSPSIIKVRYDSFSCRNYQSTGETSQENLTNSNKIDIDLNGGCLDPGTCLSKPEQEQSQEKINTNNSHADYIAYPLDNCINNEEAESDSMSQWRILYIILSDKTYLLLLLSTTGAVSFIMSYGAILPDYLVSRGFSLDQSTYIVVIASIGYIPARFLSSWLLHKNLATSINIFNLSGLFGAVLVLLYPYLSTSLTLTLLSFMLFGASGLGLAVFSVTFLDIFEQKMYPTSLGFSMTLSGLGLPITGYIISVLKDRYSSYEPCSNFLSIFCCLTIMPSVIDSLCQKWKNRQSKQPISHTVT
ncbi:hypothetical protein Ahia01_000630700 [Argonauta hians]